MKTPEEILESHCPSMSSLFLDRSGRYFREGVIRAMKEYTKLWVKDALEESHPFHVTGLVELYNKRIDAQ